MRISPIYTLFILALLFSCQSDPKVASTPVQTQSTPGVNAQGQEVIAQYDNLTKEQAEKIMADRKREKAEESAKNLPSFRAHAKELVKTRGAKEKARAFLTSDHWAYEGFFDGSAMKKQSEYVGHWIKYEDDHTYTYGQYNKEHGSGQYHYSLETDKMIMVDDKEDMMPEEWDIKAQDEVMVMVGAGYFGNNPKQCKMLRWNGRPVPPAGSI